MRIGTMTRHLLAAGLVSCAGLAPLSASALGLGEIAVHSYLGQVFRATIPLRPDAGEEIDSRCFVLGHPALPDDGTYLSQANLRLEQKNGQARLVIRSSHAFNEPFVRLLIRMDCGQGRLEREFVALLDPEERVPVALPPMASDAGVEPRLEALPEPAGKPRRARATKRASSGGIDHGVAARPLLRAAPLESGSLARPVEAQSPPAHSAAAGEFRLRLSGAELDLSMLGKLSEEQRQQLREKQRLLDADDQVANTLSMKNRIMQLESQLDQLQAELAKTNSRLGTQLASPPAAAAVTVPATPPRTGEGWLRQGENVSLRGMAGAGLIFALVASVWWRWRRRRAEAWLDAEMRQEFPADEVWQMPTAQSGEKTVTAALVSSTGPAKTEEDDFYHAATSIFDNESESVTFTEAESVLDEADLYLAYGWANRAIELLQGYLEKHPDDAQLWKKLFEMYCSQGMKQEFEQLALRCQTAMDDSSLWVQVQKLGRQLDEGNPLYSSSPEALAEAGAPETEARPEADLPTLDTPLEFVLEDKGSAAGTPEPAAKEEGLNFGPIFPEVDDKPEKGT